MVYHPPKGHIPYGTPDYLKHVGQNPGPTGRSADDEEPSEATPTWREIGHQLEREMRDVSMWEVYRGPLIVVGIVLVVVILIAAF